VQRQVLAARRRQSLAALSRKRKATMITLIHRQETVSLLGIPLARYIDIDDSQSILRAIRETPPDRPIEMCSTRPAASSWPRSRSLPHSPTTRRR
jgi:ClpP class serine protease